MTISSVSIHSGQNSMHEKGTQTVSSQLQTLPISAGRHQLKQIFSSSLLLGKKYELKGLSKRKYEKVVKYLYGSGITW